MSNQENDDLLPTETEGYKVGDKKTIEELQKLDAEDESLQKWKASLGLGASTAAAPSDDPRRVVVLQLAMEVDGRDDVLMDLSSTSALETLKISPITIKEGVDYRLKIKFKVQHEVISGLRYIQVVKKLGIPVDRQEEMIGSYGPSADAYVKTFQNEQAPSGFLYRSTYQVKSRFIDDDKNVHLEWDWQFEIKKNW